MTLYFHKTTELYELIYTNNCNEKFSYPEF